MRVIVTGASGVGKTRLVEALGPEMSLPLIPELGRQLCQNMGYKRVGDIPDQEGFKRQVLNAQIEKENELGSFIADRSTIDCWVLWQRWNINAAMTYDSEQYYDLARQQAESYSHIVYIPPMFPPPDDGFRWTEPDYQKQIDRLVRMTLYEWDLLERTYVVQSIDINDRIDEVGRWIASA